jgi:hypothetical protein
MTSILNNQQHHNFHSFSQKSRRNRPSPLENIPSPSSLRPNYFSNLAHTTQSPSPSEHSQKTRSYINDSQLQNILINSSDIPPSSLDLVMPSAFEFPQAHHADFTYLPEQTELLSSSWNNGGVGPRVASHSMVPDPRNHGHDRNPSSSSIASSQANQLYGSRAQTGQAVKSQNQHQARGAGSLPTPTQTPTKRSFLSQQQASSLPQPSHNLDNSIAASIAMDQALLQSRRNLEDNMSQLSQQRQTYTSMGEPLTPMTAVSDYQNDGRRTDPNGEKDEPLDDWLECLLSGNVESMTMVPKLERTITDAYTDNLYFPQQMQQQMPSHQVQTSYLMPQNQMMQERLHDARMARTASSSTNQSAPLSPFKANSPFTHSPRYGQQDYPIRQGGHVSPQSEPKTISPQEAMLDYKPQREEVPLFAQSGANYGSYSAVAPSSVKTQQYQNVPYLSMDGMQSSNQAWSTDLQQATLTSAPIQNYNFVAPSIPQMPNPYLGNAPAMSQRSTRQSDQNPEFPAHLTTMESSASEAPVSSGTSSALTLDSPKPMSNANTGTYSCTYHGCTHRFTTPRELQKHKRDVHRTSSNVTPGLGSGMSTQQLMERNSQSGPHRCERINPQTGKPCNSNFSRPYDLTRHEDTIHNNKKLKLRCALCTEEKLFSRNDALTRHLRVVHPEVDFPGKHRRRGTRD